MEHALLVMVFFITVPVESYWKEKGWGCSPVSHTLTYQQQSGAVEACWAHNPEVRGSKPRSAKIFPFLKMILILNCQKLSKLNGEELFASDLTFFPFGKDFKIIM